MLELSPSRSEQQQAYVLLRVLAGFDFFGHGFARIFTGTHLPAFAQGMAKGFANSPLPQSLVLPLGYVIPCAETVIGVLLLLGIGVRLGLTMALVLMSVLMFGTTMKQEWAGAALQLNYGLVLFVLLFARERYDLSWSGLVASFRRS